MTHEEKKQRLSRLAELNRRSLGVTSFSETEMKPARTSGVSRTELAELRERISFFYRNGNRDARQSWTRKYRNL